jgi:hypothetical protein
MANNWEFSTVISFMANTSLHVCVFVRARVCVSLLHKLFVQVTWYIFWMGNLRLKGCICFATSVCSSLVTL